MSEKEPIKDLIAEIEKNKRAAKEERKKDPLAHLTDDQKAQVLEARRNQNKAQEIIERATKLRVIGPERSIHDKEDSDSPEQPK